MIMVMMTVMMIIAMMMRMITECCLPLARRQLCSLSGVTWGRTVLGFEMWQDDTCYWYQVPGPRFRIVTRLWHNYPSHATGTKLEKMTKCLNNKMACAWWNNCDKMTKGPLTCCRYKVQEDTKCLNYKMMMAMVMVMTMTMKRGWLPEGEKKPNSLGGGLVGLTSATSNQHDQHYGHHDDHDHRYGHHDDHGHYDDHDQHHGHHDHDDDHGQLNLRRISWTHICLLSIRLNRHDHHCGHHYGHHDHQD